MKILFHEESLCVEIEGIHKFLALKSSITVPYSHISGVVIDPEEAHGIWHGLKAGTNIPGVLTEGSFLQKDGRIFIDMKDSTRCIQITLHDESYKALVLEAPKDITPDEFAHRITEKVSQYNEKKSS